MDSLKARGLAEAIGALTIEREVDREIAAAELAAAALPGQKLAFEVQRVHPVAEVADQTNVFPVKVRLTGRVGQDPDAAFDPPAWVRPGVEGVAKADAGRKPWIWLWVRDGVNWVRMKLWW